MPADTHSNRASSIIQQIVTAMEAELPPDIAAQLDQQNHAEFLETYISGLCLVLKEVICVADDAIHRCRVCDTVGKGKCAHCIAAAVHMREQCGTLANFSALYQIYKKRHNIPD